jgi:hypothetical protein
MPTPVKKLLGFLNKSTEERKVAFRFLIIVAFVQLHRLLKSEEVAPQH